MRGIALYRRLLLAALLVALPLCQSAAHAARGAAGKSFSLLISPSTIPAGEASTVVVRAFSGQNTPLAGVTLAISGATVGSGPLVTGTAPLVLHLTPAAMKPIQVRATAGGYQPVAATIGVQAAVPPAVVSILHASMSLAAPASSTFQSATLREPVFYGWHVRTTANQRGALTFSDGSVLDLDRSSEVLIQSPTRIYLTGGQVFLQVVAGGQSHDIVAGSATAASLGTRYMVSLVGGTPSVTVEVGRVSLRVNGRTISVGPSQRAVVGANGVPGTPRTTNVQPYIMWTDTLGDLAGTFNTADVYILGKDGLNLLHFSIDQQKVTQTIPMSPTVTATDLSLNQTGNNVYVATSTGILDLALPGARLHALTSSSGSNALAVLPDGNLAVAMQQDVVVVLNPTSGQLVQTIAVGYPATAIAVSPDGATAVVGGAGHVSLIDLVHGIVLASATSSGVPGHPTFTNDGQIAIVPMSSGKLLLLSPVTRGIVGTIPLGASRPTAEAYPGAVVTEDGTVFVADGIRDQLIAVDPVMQQVLAHYPLGGGRPTAIGLASDGKLVVVTHEPSALLEVDPADGTVLSRAGTSATGDAVTVTHPTRATGAGTAQGSTSAITATTTISPTATPAA